MEVSIDPAAKDIQVSIVLPAHNEERAIGPTVEEVREAMNKTDYVYEIVVVDDASTDNTPAEVVAHGARLVRRPLRGGSGAARKTGIVDARGEYVVHLDADGTYVAADIPALLAHLPEYDQVNGARTSEQGTRAWLRVPTKWFMRRLASYLANYNIPDLNTGLKAFKRSVMLNYLWVLPEGFSCVSSMTLAFLVNGHPVRYVATGYRKRIGESKFHPVHDTLQYLETVLRIIVYFRPLRVFLPLSLILGLIAFTLAVTNLLTSGFVHATEIVIGLTGIITLGVGLLADLIVVHARRPR